MAKLRCRVGDLAIVTRCSRPGVVGRIVYVEATAASVNPDRAMRGYDWLVRSEGSPLPTSKGLQPKAFATDGQLQPIRPGPASKRRKAHVEA